MNFQLKSMPLAIASAIAGGAMSMAAISPAIAQVTSAEPAPQRVVVTGSLISRTDLETAAPVQVITAQDIQRSGKTSVAELLTDIAANGAGTLGSGFSGAFANGASGISLRGLTVGATLVLIDGHRLAPYPLSDDSQRSFVDVSNIPFDAIESIEILKSGASALYGSDAIAGVVNIKLKKNFTGTRLSAESGTTQHGGGKTHRAAISTGLGDLEADGYNAFVTAEWRRQGDIKVADRTQFGWDNPDWRGRGGRDLTLGRPTTVNSFLTPTNTPFLYNPSGAGGADNAANFTFLDPTRCNYALYRAGQCGIADNTSFIQPATENINVLLGMTRKLGQNWELGFKGSFFQRDSFNNRGTYLPAYNENAFNGYTAVTAGSATPGVGRIPSTLFAPGAQVGTGIVNPYGNPARLYGYLADVDPNVSLANRATTTRFALDLHGSAYGWDVNAAAGVTKVRTDIDYSGYVDRVALYANLANGSYNVLGGNSPAVIAQISPRFSNTLTSDLNYADLSGSRELMTLGAGPLALAAGVHWHKREQNAPAPFLTAIAQVASTRAFTIGSETNSAAFAELQATPIRNVEAHISGRYDHYDTYGNSFTPAATLKWAPAREFAVRGTFARGFRAPNPAEFGNAGSIFTFNRINDPILCANGSRTTLNNVPSACNIAPTYVQTTNPDLSPEKSKSFTFGFVTEPLRGLTATLDYYNIKLSNQIVTRAGNDPTYDPVLVRAPAGPIDISTGVGTGTFVGIPPVGPIQYAASPYINAGSTKTTGIEADIGYRWRLGGDLGTVRANLSAAHTFSYITEVAGTTYQLAGTQGPSVVSGATGSPKDRAQFSLDYTRGPLDVTASVNYTSDFSTLDPSVGGTSCDETAAVVGGRTYFDGLVQPAYYCRVASFTVTNLNLQYKLSENLSLKAAILNVFDRQPPYDVATYGNSGTQTSYNASLHQAGAVGRFYSLGLNYVF